MGWRPNHQTNNVYEIKSPKRRRVRPVFCRSYWRKKLPWITIFLPVAILLGFSAFSSSPEPWSVAVTLKHLAAKPNCDAARAVGLAPAMRGQPGYYPQHDRDQDGIACEPWPR
ncbi:MAG: excalibur calcium-binding domain-containing protein [Alphaproteobacteria bacterium GM202ARS2]|nr:excalibur calcium-binding domain-containing protein [Alphaproteobacteria bacterium GM202ARS2]